MKRLIILSAAVVAGCSGSPSGELTCGSERLCQTRQTIPVDMTGVSDSTSSGSSDKVSAQGLLDPVLSLTPVLTLVATLAPPTINAQPLQASDITVNGSKIYVAYNTAGETQAGGIDMIDISSTSSPVLKSQALYPTADIHKVIVDGSDLYAVGAMSGVNEGAMLYKIGLDATGAMTTAKTEKNLRRSADVSPAYAGVSVKATSSYLYAVSGNNGGLSILNKADLSDVAFAPVDDARDVSVGPSGEIYVVSGKTAGEDAKLKRFDASSAAPMTSATLTLPGATTDGGKSSVITGGKFHVATAGSGGAKLMCIDGGAVYGSMANPSLAGVAANLQVANAAAFGNGLIYVANGEAGVSIYSLERTLVTVGCVGHSIQYRGRFTFGPGISANNVFWTNGFLVVATGKGGFKLIQVTQSLVAGLLQIL